jgi:hypothetical protein
MAKKVASERTQDRPRSGFMLRLPEEHRIVLEELRSKYRRSLTTEVQIALEKHYRDEGIAFPPIPPGETHEGTPTNDAGIEIGDAETPTSESGPGKGQKRGKGKRTGKK